MPSIQLFNNKKSRHSDFKLGDSQNSSKKHLESSFSGSLAPSGDPSSNVILTQSKASAQYVKSSISNAIED